MGADRPSDVRSADKLKALMEKNKDKIGDTDDARANFVVNFCENFYKEEHAAGSIGDSEFDHLIRSIKKFKLENNITTIHG